MYNHKSNDAMRNLTLTAAFSALGVVVPAIFHLAGLGSVFMPMFIPLAVGAFLMTPGNALLAGAVTPLASALITGMPPFYPPVALVMIPELALFCFTISALNNKTTLPKTAVIIIAVILDRVFILGSYYFIYPLLEISSAFSLWNIMKGAPGLIIIIAAAPFMGSKLEALLNRSAIYPCEYSAETVRESENG